jgi:hypothetical protein
MSVLFCVGCGFVRELPEEHLGKIVRCPSCEKPAKVMQTQIVVKSLLDRVRKLQGELRDIRQTAAETEVAQPWSGFLGYEFSQSPVAQQLTNTQPAVDWFQARGIVVEADPKAADISGFFDEIAVALGDEFDLLAFVIDKINFAYRKGFYRVNIGLEEYSQEQIGKIKGFCRELYEAAFVAKYFRPKGEKQVQLHLQANQPALKSFFGGEWLEWYAFMKIASLLVQSGRPFSCLKNFQARFPNGDSYELDLFFLVEGRIPLWVECKSGEFRNAIGKYTQMRGQMRLERPNMLLLALEVPDDRLAGMSSTFDTVMSNHRSFLGYANGLFGTNGGASAHSSSASA